MSPTEPALPDGYADLLEKLKSTAAAARWHAQRVVNTELLRLYWRLGSAVLERQREVGWGIRVIDRLGTDLRAAFPDMRGLSRSNIHSMRKMADAWSEQAIVQQAVGQLPWGHVTVLLDKISDQDERDWYAAAAAEHGWSRDVLRQQIMNQLHRRIGAAPSNFPAQLASVDSELAQQLTRVYVVDRAKDMILSGGVNIFPSEIEEVLAAHPDVVQVAVVGLPDDRWGEVVTAYVVSRGGQQADESELDALCLDRMAAYKRPRRYVFVDALPQNSSGKLLKHELRAAAVRSTA